MFYIGCSRLHMRLLRGSMNLVHNRLHLENFLMSGSSPMKLVGCLRPNCSVYLNAFPRRNCIRCVDPGRRPYCGLIFHLEILHGGGTRQTHKAPQHPADRGRSTTVISILCGVRVDGKWGRVSIYHEVPGSGSLGTGTSRASMADLVFIVC